MELLLPLGRLLEGAVNITSSPAKGAPGQSGFNAGGGKLKEL